MECNPWRTKADPPPCPLTEPQHLGLPPDMGYFATLAGLFVVLGFGLLATVALAPLLGWSGLLLLLLTVSLLSLGFLRQAGVLSLAAYWPSLVVVGLGRGAIA